MKKFFIGIFILLALAAGLFFFVENRGNNKQSDMYEGLSFLYEDKLVDKKDYYRQEDGQLYISYDFIKENIDKNINFNESENKVYINNSKGSKVLPLDSKEANFSGHKVILRSPVKKIDGKLMLPIESFIYDYNFDLRYDKDNKSYVLDNLSISHKIATTTTDVNLREMSKKRSKLIKKVPKNSQVFLYDQENSYYRVREYNGYAGYVHKDYLDNITEIPPHELNTQAKKPLNITWDYTYAGHSEDKIANIKNIPGVDIIIPTWFSIMNGNGDLIDRGNIDYVNRYRAMGIDVWGYLDNSFDAEITNKALSNENSRKKIIDKTIELCKKYGMKGLNIDFEGFKISDRDLFTTFVKELSEKAKSENIMISVDVTPQISSDVTKEPYDRKALAEICDLVVIMAYDQHWSSSEKSGSVAEYPWVEGSINVLFKSIPRDKMILGVPLYSRLWCEKNGKVSSKAISMDQTNNIIGSKGLTPKWNDECGQFYVEFNEGDALYKIWLEEKNSLALKTSLVNKYKLRGVASWRLGFETFDIWDAINNEIKDLKY